MIAVHWIPCYRSSVHPQIVAQTMRDVLWATAHKWDYHYLWHDGSDICRMRNEAMRQAIDLGADYLLMQDNDVYSKSASGALARLHSVMLETKATLVGGMVGLRDGKRCNVAPAKPMTVYECDEIGTGIVLIDVQKVKSMDHAGAWFEREYSERGSNIVVGEDIWFSRLLRRHGHKIVCDALLPTTHARLDVDSLDYDPMSIARAIKDGEGK